MPLIDELRQEHRKTITLLDSFLEILNLPDLDRGALKDALAYNATYFIDTPDDSHHCKEKILYWQLRLRVGYYNPKMPSLLEDHRHLRDMRKRMCDLILRITRNGGLPSAADRAFAAQYVQDVKEQIQKEESVLFPLAERYFKASDWAEVDSAVADLTNAIFLANPVPSATPLTMSVA